MGEKLSYAKDPAQAMGHFVCKGCYSFRNWLTVVEQLAIYVLMALIDHCR